MSVRFILKLESTAAIGDGGLVLISPRGYNSSASSSCFISFNRMLIGFDRVAIGDDTLTGWIVLSALESSSFPSTARMSPNTRPRALRSTYSSCRFVSRNKNVERRTGSLLRQFNLLLYLEMYLTWNETTRGR